MKKQTCQFARRTLATGVISAVYAAFVGLVGVATAPIAWSQTENGIANELKKSEVQSRSTRIVTLKDIGAEQPIRLRGTEHQIDFPISIRSDEMVTRARLHLRYAHSPSLVFEWSHIAVLINNEVVGLLPLVSATADGSKTIIEIDPRNLVGYSQLGMRAVMHYTKECEDPTHTSLWSVIANDSKLELEVEHIARAHELADLPAPFFDAHDRKKLVLPVILPERPNTAELEAAAMVASWFGAMAEYRGARFPVYLGSLPEQGNAVMVATRSRLPTELNIDKGIGAQIGIVGNPADDQGRVLVLTGDDPPSLLIAARALALGSDVLSGDSTNIQDLSNAQTREAYDAPRWVPTDRAVRLGERIAPEKLQVRGQHPDPIRVPWNLPPDLFFWGSKGAKFDIGFRYTPMPETHSTVDLDINNQFARALPLSMYDSPKDLQYQVWRALDFPVVEKREHYRVPLYKFGSKNELKWQYNFETRRIGNCEDQPETYLRASIDADSTIDLSGLPHYTYLPDLKLFVDGAFPFTKFADLSQTVAVLPRTPTGAEIGAFLNVMGHIGNATGYPATRLRVTDASTVTALDADADLLVFGTPLSQPLYGQWAPRLPTSLSANGTQLQVIGGVERLRARLGGRDLDGARAHASKMIVAAGDSLGAIMSFESPLAAGRTVVAFSALNDERLLALSELLDDGSRRHFIGGDLTLLNKGKVSSYALAPQYGVGQLPVLMSIRWWFAQQPILLSVLAIFLVLLVAMMLFRLMRMLAFARQENR